MKAIILAAGEGRRLRPLTDNKPKCMVELFGKNLLESKQYFNLNDLTDDLLINGIKLFQESYISVLEKIEEKIEKIIKN